MWDFVHFAIWSILILVFGIPIGILKIYKFILETIVTRIQINDEKLYPLSAVDAMCAPDASWVKSHINVGFVMKLRKRENGKYFCIDELRDHFYNVFLNKTMPGGTYDKLLSYITSKAGYTFRVQTNHIDLYKHIFKFDWESDGRYQFLEDILAKWFAAKWEEKRPCWQIILLENLSGCEEHLFLAFKIHHGLADGYSVLHILDKLTNNTSPYLVRDFEESKFARIRKLIKCPTYYQKLIGLPPKNNPFRMHLTESNFHDFILAFTSFPLDCIKAIRKKHDVHFASVIFAIMIGALRRYAEVEEKGKQITEATEFGFATSLPCPRHPSRDNGAHNVDRICNHWTLGNGKVAFGEKDPIKRMKKIENELETCKELGIPGFINQVIFPVLSTLPSSLTLIGMNMGYGGHLTSLVGGESYSLLGCKAEKIFPIDSYQDTIPYSPVLCFTFSHSGVMDMSVRFHQSVVKDQETANTITEVLFREELDSLMKASM